MDTLDVISDGQAEAFFRALFHHFGRVALGFFVNFFLTRTERADDKKLLVRTKDDVVEVLSAFIVAVTGGSECPFLAPAHPPCSIRVPQPRR